MVPDHLKSLRTFILPRKSTIKKHQNRSTKRSLLSRLMLLPYRKQHLMLQSRKLTRLHQRLPRRLGHWVPMANPGRLQLTDCTAPGLGRATLGMMPMRHMDVLIPLHHSPANSPLFHCHRTSATCEPPVPISHPRLRCNMVTAPPTYLHPLVQRPLAPFRHTQQLLLVCHSPLHRLTNSLLLDLHFRDQKPHRHRVLHLARGTERSASLQRSRAHLFRPRQKRVVRRRLLRAPSREVLYYPQGCQNVGTQCNQGYLRPPPEQRNGINGVDQAFLP